MSKNYEEIPSGYSELECSKHGAFLTKRKANGEGEGWNNNQCPLCKMECNPIPTQPKGDNLGTDY